MEESTDTPDLTRDADHIAALERQIAVMGDEINALVRTVSEQQADVVAAKELEVLAAERELRVAQLELSVAQMRERLRARGREPEPEMRFVSELRGASSPRTAGPLTAAVPELRWIAEIVQAE